MKTFEVELCRTSYITLTVEAENEDDAEDKAWKEIQAGYRPDDSSWVVESVEEIFS